MLVETSIKKMRLPQLRVANALEIDPPSRFLVEFNPRAGIVRCADADILFINVERISKAVRYPNTWSENGQQLTFFLRQSQWQGGNSPLGKRLKDAQTDDQVLLFARPGQKKLSKFIFCGRVRVVNDSLDESSELITLQLELLDFSRITKSQSFRDLVSLQDSAHAGASVAEQGSGPIVLGGIDDDLKVQEMLAAKINTGDVTGALVAALDLAGTKTPKRSIEAGLASLKKMLARSHDPEVLRAVSLLDDVGEKLGYF
jgi:hypothetical protein